MINTNSTQDERASFAASHHGQLSPIEKVLLSSLLSTGSEYNDCFVTRTCAAAILGVNPQTLAVRASKGLYDIPYTKVLRTVKYRLGDIKSYLQRNTRSQSVAA